MYRFWKCDVPYVYNSTTPYVSGRLWARGCGAGPGGSLLIVLVLTLRLSRLAAARTRQLIHQQFHIHTTNKVLLTLPDLGGFRKKACREILKQFFAAGLGQPMLNSQTEPVRSVRRLQFTINTVRRFLLQKFSAS